MIMIRKLSTFLLRELCMCMLLVLISTSLNAKEDFFLSGLTKVGYAHPWLNKYYPDYMLDIRNDLFNDGDFQKLLTKVKVMHPKGTIELELIRYPKDNVIENLIAGSFGIVSNVFKGKTNQLFSEFDNSMAVEMIIGSNIYTGVVFDTDKSDFSAPSGDDDKTVRNQIYKSLRDKLVDWYTLALQSIVDSFDSKG